MENLQRFSYVTARVGHHKERRINELFPELEPELDTGNNKEYAVEAIIDSVVYAKEAKRDLPGLYYLVSWKSYPEEESIWEPYSIVMYLQKMISTFHKDHLEKPTTTSLRFSFAPLMTKPSVKPAKLSAKRKQGRLIGLIIQAKK